MGTSQLSSTMKYMPNGTALPSPYLNDNVSSNALHFPVASHHSMSSTSMYPILSAPNQMMYTYNDMVHNAINESLTSSTMDSYVPSGIPMDGTSGLTSRSDPRLASPEAMSPTPALNMVLGNAHDDLTRDPVCDLSGHQVKLNDHTPVKHGSFNDTSLLDDFVYREEGLGVLDANCNETPDKGLIDPSSDLDRGMNTPPILHKHVSQ